MEPILFVAWLQQVSRPWPVPLRTATNPDPKGEQPGIMVLEKTGRLVGSRRGCYGQTNGIPETWVSIPLPGVELRQSARGSLSLRWRLENDRLEHRRPQLPVCTT